MKRYLLFALFIIPFVAQSQTFVRTTPKWYTKPPKATGKIYGVGSESSSNLEMAERKATMTAKVQLAKQVEPVLKTTITRIDSIADGDKLVLERVTLVKETLKAELTEVTTINKAFKKRKGQYIAYVLLEMDVKDIKRSFAEKVRNDELIREKIIGKTATRSFLDEGQ